MLIVAGIGYLVDFTLFFLVPQIDFKVSVYTFIGEVMLILWLLVMGVNTKSGSNVCGQLPKRRHYSTCPKRFQKTQN